MNWVLTCDRYFDGHDFVDTPSTVVVRDGRIAAVHDGVKAPSELNGALKGAASDVETLHAPTLMPGLIDSHIHLVGFPHGPPGGSPFELETNGLRLLTCNGVTTVRDAGNAIETTQYCRYWSARNSGPRIVPTSPVLDAPPLLWGFSRVAEDADTARRHVDALVGEGVAWISLFQNLPADAARAALEAAHANDLRVLADLKSLSGVEQSERGVASIEHVHNLLDVDDDGATTKTVIGRMRRWSQIDVDGPRVDRLVETLREHDTAVSTTLLFTERWCSVEDMVYEPNLEYMAAVMPFAENLLRMRSPMGMMMGKRKLREGLGVPAVKGEAEAEVEAGLDAVRALVRRLDDAGVRLVAGTDAPSPSLVPGFSLHQELERLVGAGLSPAAALRTATSQAAALLQRDDLGVVREGARADLLLVDGDPSDDVGTTRKITAVFRDGQRANRGELFKPIQACVDAL